MFRTVIGAFCIVAMASGADFSGIWSGVMADRNGDLQDLSFRFSQAHSSLTGKMYGDNESIPITDGKVDGDRISFIVTTELNGSISRLSFTGTLVGGEIHVTRAKVEPPVSSNPPEKPVAAKPPQKQTFVLKHL